MLSSCKAISRHSHVAFASQPARRHLFPRIVSSGLPDVVSTSNAGCISPHDAPRYDPDRVLKPYEINLCGVGIASGRRLTQSGTGRAIALVRLPLGSACGNSASLDRSRCAEAVVHVEAGGSIFPCRLIRTPEFNVCGTISASWADSGPSIRVTLRRRGRRASLKSAVPIASVNQRNMPINAQTIRRILLIACLSIADAAFAQPNDEDRSQSQTGIDDSALQSVKALKERIEALRMTGDYASAVPVAKQLHSLMAAQSSPSPFEIDDARRSVETLEQISELPATAQKELQEADAAADAIDIQDLDALYHQIDVRSRLLGETHAETLSWLARLSAALREAGRITDAELILRRSIAGRRETLGDNHPSTLQSLSHLAIVMHYQGDYPEAERLFRHVADSRRRVQGADHPDTRGAECNLARMLYEVGRLEEAEQLYTPLIEWYQRRYGEDYYISLYCMAGLACVQRARGEFDDAEQLLRRRLEISRRLKGDDPSDDLDAMNALSLVLYERGDLANAEKACREALSVHKRIKDVDDHKLVELTNNLADILHAQGRYDEAEAAWRRAAVSFEAVRSRISYAGFERIRFAADESPFLRLAACQARNGKPAEAWNNLERGLARGLIDAVDVSSDRARIAMSVEEKAARARLLAQMQQSEERLAIVEADDDATTASKDEARRTRNAARVDVIAFDKRMAERYGVPGSEPYELDRVQRQLSDQMAIIAWLDFPASPETAASAEHWACVVRHEGPPKWIRLSGTRSQSHWSSRDTSLAERVSMQLAKRPTTRVDLNRDLRALLAQRVRSIESHLNGIEHIVVLPIGPMSRIPLQALTDRYTISYAPSATLFAWLAESDAPGRVRHRGESLLAVGDPNYTSTGSAGLGPIPGTGHEVRAIGRIFTSRAGNLDNPGKDASAIPDPVTTLYLRQDAAEANIQELAVNNRLRDYTHIHLSAHAILNDRAPWRSALLLSQTPATDVLSRVMQASPVFDGRLTAQQIVQTWRLDAELVTLSGCETALGKAEGGEGLVGFSQALLASGARSLVLSLWKVDDMATALLMHRFYENLTGAFVDHRRIAGIDYPQGHPMPKAIALREAKRWIRSNSAEQNRTALRGMGFPIPKDNTALASARAGIRMSKERPLAAFDYSDPHFWAAFILTGSPD